MKVQGCSNPGFSFTSKYKNATISIYSFVNTKCAPGQYEYQQFQDVLKSKGVEEIPALGETFDPELHEAVSSVQDDSKGEKEIVQEYRKGYKIGHKVIRHSMVVVAN